MKIELAGPEEWILLTIICAMLILSPIALRRHWKGKTTAADWTMSGMWYRSDDYRRGHMRALPMVYVTGLAVLLFGLPLIHAGMSLAVVKVGRLSHGEKRLLW